MSDKISLFSMFSGIGILDLGFENNNYNIVMVNEYKESFINAYKFSREKLKKAQPKYGYVNDSIENLKKYFIDEKIKQEKSEGNLVGFIGCPPCPDFSIGGKNKGKEGDNGKLAKIYVNAITTYKPDFFIFENVKGLVKTQKHKKYFDYLKATLKRHNYVIADNVINAVAFGVPQSRERVVMVGFKKEILNPNAYKGKKLIFDFYDGSEFDVNEIVKPENLIKNEFLEDSILPNDHIIPEKLTVEYWFKKNHVEDHDNAQDVFKVRCKDGKFDTISEGDTSRKSFKRLHRWRYSPTVAYGNNEVHLHPYKPRRLSVAEALAIQTLPEEFVVDPKLTLSDKFKMIGNGVPYLMAYSLAESLSKFIDKSVRI